MQTLAIIIDFSILGLLFAWMLYRTLEPNSTRRFFQLHLSTGIVLVLSTSALLWANLRNFVAAHKVGWPFEEPAEFQTGALWLDTFIAFWCMAIVAMVCESKLRRIPWALTVFRLFAALVVGFVILIFIYFALPSIDAPFRKK